ncbi:hypothetical protein GCM10022381_32830 [Leifsonia kafniensis]|uniref:Uncharacterized protein n=1 Tax=Leifsonia kafniensis TaxID=475957 RepID=A0ABP7KVK9_9MICO
MGADGPGIRMGECGELDVALLFEKSSQGRLFLVSVTHLTPSGWAVRNFGRHGTGTPAGLGPTRRIIPA